MTAELAEGTRLGRYSLLKLLASGGMANVWLARVEGAGGFQKTVVVKTILPHLADDPEFVRMLIDEAIVASKIQHPNVVNIFDLGEVDNSYFIAMEYIAGRTLRHVQREVKKTKRAPPPWFVLHIVASACDGLHYGHTMLDENGRLMHIVHRDVSPENIMVAFTGETKILDFGIAKASTMASKTSAGVLKGKKAYMAPEQIEGAVEGKPPHPRTDVYALGVVLYELLTGRRPFRAANELALLRLILDTVPEPPHKVCAWVPEPLSGMVMKAMARDVDQRFQSGLELRIAIETYLHSAGLFPTREHVANYLRALFSGDGSTAQATGPEAKSSVSSRKSLPSGVGWSDSQRTDDFWQKSEDLASPVAIDVSMAADDDEPDSAPPKAAGDLTIDVIDDFDIIGDATSDVSGPLASRSSTEVDDIDIPRPTTAGTGAKAASAKKMPSEDGDLPQPSTGGMRSAAPSPKKKPPEDDDMPRPTTTGARAAAPAEKKVVEDIDMPRPTTTGARAGASAGQKKVADDVDIPRPATTGGRGTKKASQDGEIPVSTTRGTSASKMSPFEKAVASRRSEEEARLEKDKKEEEKVPSEVSKAPPPSGVHLWDKVTQRVRKEKEYEEERQGGRDAAEDGPTKRGALDAEEPAEKTSSGGHAWDLVVGRIRSSSGGEEDMVNKSWEARRPKRASDWFDEGLQYWRRKDFDGTLICWTKALEMDPDNRVYESNLRKLKQQLSERDKNQ